MFLVVYLFGYIAVIHVTTCKRGRIITRSHKQQSYVCNQSINFDSVSEEMTLGGITFTAYDLGGHEMGMYNRCFLCIL